MILRAAAAAAVLFAVSSASGAAGRIVTIGEAFDGGSVSLTPGDELAVGLPAVAGTGYGWEIAFLDAAVLKPVGEPVSETPPESRELAGAAGTQTLRFRAAGEGTSALGLAYRRPWEASAAPARLFRVQVHVRGEAIRRPFMLEEPDNGSKIFLLQGDTVTVKLPANPTTGYSWAIAQAAPSVLRPVGEARYQGPAKAVPGAGGFQTREFRVAGPGSAWLQLAYRRPFEEDAPAARTWSIFVAAAGVVATP